jgi:hypothetical protein
MGMTLSYQVAYVAVWFVCAFRAFWLLGKQVEANVEKFGWMAVNQFLVLLSVWWSGTFIWHVYIFFGGAGGPSYVGGHAGFR